MSPNFLTYSSRLIDIYSSPQNAKELFNLRHASLRNVIERIFGVMKRQWRVLQFPPEYNMDVQALLPMALCALHNFTRRHDPDFGFNSDHDSDLGLDDDLLVAGDDDVNGVSGLQGELAEGPADAGERRRADRRRDEIAAVMWADYVEERTRRGLAVPAAM